MTAVAWAGALDEVPPVATPPGRIAILSAHPDDDVIALGRWLAGVPADTVLVVATDGEASHPGSDVIAPGELRRRRAVEHVEALAELGLDLPVHRLGLPDSDLAAHEPELTARLEDLLTDVDLVVAPYRHDGHPDHEAVGRAAERVHDGPRWEYPVWTWVWSSPEPALVGRLRRVPSHADSTAKRAALARYRTQVEPVGDAAPIVTAELLEHALTAPEVVVV